VGPSATNFEIVLVSHIDVAVILNGVKNLDQLVDNQRRDPSAWPQDDIKGVDVPKFYA
jgi:hypothetical protein